MSRIERPQLQTSAKVAASGEAKALGTKVGELAGTHFRDQLTVGSVAKEAGVSGLFNVPFEGLIQSQAYRRGEIRANEYAAKVVVNSVGFGAWTVGGALAGTVLGPLGTYVGGALGFAAGMVSQSLFDRLIGHRLTAQVADALPEDGVKPFADGFARFVANPLHDYVWKPASTFVKSHKFLSAGILALAALRFPGASLGLLRGGSVMAGGLAAGLAVDRLVLDKVFGPSTAHAGAHGAPGGEPVAVEPAWVDAFHQAQARFEAQGMARIDAAMATRRHFAELLLESGATDEQAQALVEAIAGQAAEASAPASLASRPLVG